MKAKITAKLETSSHDSRYCSDNNCEYDTYIVVKNIDVPREYENYDLEEKIEYIDQNYWTKFLDPPAGITCCGSGYCSLSNECSKNGLDRHDYKFTIISVKIYQ